MVRRKSTATASLPRETEASAPPAKPRTGKTASPNLHVEAGAHATKAVRQAIDRAVAEVAAAHEAAQQAVIAAVHGPRS